MNRQKEVKLAGDYIPIEIHGEIMKRLPLKSLIRFRCVSKPWDSLIRSSKFIRDYHAFHPEQPHHRLLIRLSLKGRDNHQEKYFSILHDDTFPKKILRKIIREKYFSILYDDTFPKQMLPHIIPKSARRFDDAMTVCSSHGLFCFYNKFSYTDPSKKKRAVIWNPTIRKSVNIDLPNVLNTLNNYTTVIGFGICPHPSDIKLVRIISHGESNNIPMQVEIFSLKSGSWRSLNSNLLSGKSYLWYKYNQVVIDKYIYWLVDETVYVDGEKRYKKLILSFDMISEEFVELPLPEGAKLDGYFHISISKFKESLVVFATLGSDLPVWIMHNGDPKSFKLLFTIRPDIFISDVLGFTESGQPIIVTKEVQQKRSSVEVEVYKVFVYEPITKRIKPTGITTGALNTTNSFLECSYAESLLLLDQ